MKELEARINKNVIDRYSNLKEIKTIVAKKLSDIGEDGFLVVQTQDVRING